VTNNLSKITGSYYNPGKEQSAGLFDGFSASRKILIPAIVNLKKGSRELRNLMDSSFTQIRFYIYQFKRRLGRD